MRPLQPGDEAKQILEPEVVDAIFSVIPQLLIKHQEFLKLLEQRVNDLDAFKLQSVGDVFITQVRDISPFPPLLSISHTHPSPLL